MDKPKVFVDGACRNNGHNNPQGGCGVYWDFLHPLNSSERLRGEKQTNNRAELSAAIMAIAQGITLDISELEITTDSKYVKDGITKWIHEWKINGWKTSRTGKKKGDVLNRDLWVMLDFLAEQIKVEWTWVEGHQDVDGNLQADTLAKKGISTERFVWQDIALNLFKSKPGRVYSLDENNSMEQHKEETTDKPQFPCKKCQMNCFQGENCIQCQDCKVWIHYSCSDLPPYQLYLYENTQRKFTCEFCADVDEDFETCFKDQPEGGKEDTLNSSLSVKSPSPNNNDLDSSKISTGQENINVNIKKLLTNTSSSQTEGPFHTSELVNQSSVLKESTSCQTEEPFYDFELFKTSSIALLQESFVNSFNKINDCIRTMKMNKSEEIEMKQRITTLTKENEKLKENTRNEPKEAQKFKPPCTACTEFTTRVEKLNKMIEKEREKSQQTLHNLTVEKETQISKLHAEINMLRHALELSARKCNTSESEMASMEKRIEAKNNYITSLEEQKHKLSDKINNLEDEILSWKLNECKAKDEGLFQKVTCKQTKQIEDNTFKDVNHQSDDENKEKNKPKATNDTKENQELPEPSSESQEIMATSQQLGKNSTVIQHTNKNSDHRGVVQIIGTSNISYISPAYIGESEFSVSKITKYTLDETYEYFENLTSLARYDAFILHSLCNDLRRKSPEECVDGIIKITEKALDKYPDTKLIISLGLPQSDEKTNCCIEKTNILIKERVSGMRQVFLCDNGNFFYKGQAQKGVLKDDGLHLTRTGTRKLGRNIKEALWDAFDIPILLHYEPRRRNENKTDSQNAEKQISNDEDRDSQNNKEQNKERRTEAKSLQEKQTHIDNDRKHVNVTTENDTLTKEERYSRADNDSSHKERNIRNDTYHREWRNHMNKTETDEKQTHHRDSYDREGPDSDVWNTYRRSSGADSARYQQRHTGIQVREHASRQHSIFLKGGRRSQINGTESGWKGNNYDRTMPNRRPKPTTNYYDNSMKLNNIIKHDWDWRLQNRESNMQDSYNHYGIVDGDRRSVNKQWAGHGELLSHRYGFRDGNNQYNNYGKQDTRRGYFNRMGTTERNFQTPAHESVLMRNHQTWSGGNYRTQYAGRRPNNNFSSQDWDKWSNCSYDSMRDYDEQANDHYYN